MEPVIQEKIYVKSTGLISRKHAAMALGVRPKTLCVWQSKGFGPRPVKVGGRIHYRWDEVDSFAKGNF